MYLLPKFCRVIQTNKSSVEVIVVCSKSNVEYGGIVEEFDADFEIDDRLLTRIKIWLRDIFK